MTNNPRAARGFMKKWGLATLLSSGACTLFFRTMTPGKTLRTHLFFITSIQMNVKFEYSYTKQ